MSRRRDEGRLQRAAEAGDMEAATSLADMLEDDGDLSGAERWNRVAATAGDMHGALGLGLILAGKGNLEQAAEWLRTAATSKNPPSEKMAALAAGALGRALLQLNDIDEAEAWIEKGAAAGFEEAQEDLEKLQRIRSGHTEHGASSGSSSETLQAFEVSGVMFFDGSGHRLGPSLCTLTRTRFIIEDARGGISQILLRDINGVSTPGRIVSPKQLRITSPGVAYDIYCESKDQKNLLESWLARAIRGS